MEKIKLMNIDHMRFTEEQSNTWMMLVAVWKNEFKNGDTKLDFFNWLYEEIN